VTVYAVRQRKGWQEPLCASAQTRATRLYDPLDFLLEPKKQAEADLLRDGKTHATVRILETAPGFAARNRLLRADSRSPLGPRRDHASPLPDEATVLELLRARNREPAELAMCGDALRRP